MAEYHSFDDWQTAVEKQIAQAWMANGSSLSFAPWDREIGVGHVLQEGEDDGFEIRQARIDTFQRLMDFIWADGANPIHALRRLFVITRCGSASHLALMNQTEVAVLLNETRAATSTRELKLWQAFMRDRGFFGVKRPGMKGEGAKKAYAARAAGNRNRKGGKKAIAKFSVLREEHAKSKRKKNHKPTSKPKTTQSDEA